MLMKPQKGNSMDYARNIRLALPILRRARDYHQHQVIGLDHVPEKGSALLVLNHSLATYDILLLLAAIHDQTGRVPRPLIDRLFFKIPLLGQLATSVGSLEGNPRNAQSLANDGHLIAVAPGGMREALRPSREKYQIHWYGRKGFAKLAMQSGMPIILCACPHADDLYDVYPSYLTAWFYSTYRVPVPFAKGRGLSLLPKPVKLIHTLSPPIMPPPWPTDPDQASVVLSEFHQRLVSDMEQLMINALTT